MNLLTHEQYLKSAKMILKRVRGTRPPVELEQLEFLVESGFEVETDLPEGKSDIILNGLYTSLKRLDKGDSSLISNQFKNSSQEDDYLKQYEWFYELLIQHNLNFLKEIIKFEECYSLIHFLVFAGHLNGRQAVPAEQLVLSGRLKNRMNTHAIVSIQIGDIVGLEKLFNSLKIEFTSKKGLGLRVNNSELFTQFNINKKRVAHSSTAILYGKI